MDSAWDNDGRPASHSHLSTSRTPSHAALFSLPLALSQLIPQMLPFSLGVPLCHNLGQMPFISLEAVKIDRKEILFGRKLFLKALLSLLRSHFSIMLYQFEIKLK